MSDDPNGAVEPAAGDVPVDNDPYAAFARDLFSRNVGLGENDYGRQPATSPVLGLPYNVTMELDALRKVKEAAKLVTANHFLGISFTGRDWRKDHETLRDALRDALDDCE